MPNSVMASIRRMVSIPRFIHKENILAIVEVGGRILTKELIYRKFFEHGLAGVKKDLLAEVESRGGTPQQLTKLLEDAGKRYSKA